MLLLRRLPALAATLLLAAGLALPAAATLTAEDQQEIRNYTLTTGYLDKVEAMTEDAVARGVKASLDPADFREAENLDALAARLDAKPGVHALFADNGLTAREYLKGALALFGAALAVKAEEQPEKAPQVDPAKVAPQHVAFYRQHRAAIESLMATSAD